MHKVKIKALSVNAAWQGKRFKTPEYKAYERDLFHLLPKGLELPTGPLALFLEVGQSNMAADFDNPVKPFVDILSKKYGFNDKLIVEAIIRKRKVEKGDEYISFNLVAAD